MNPALDQILVAAAVLGAAAFFIARIVRKRKKRSCDSSCGCGVARRLPKPPASAR
jgi:hypothetical protein